MSTGCLHLRPAVSGSRLFSPAHLPIHRRKVSLHGTVQLREMGVSVHRQRQTLAASSVLRPLHSKPLCAVSTDGIQDQLIQHPPLRSRRHLTLADFPSIVEQWHPDKNSWKQPSDIGASNAQEVWLKCSGCIHGCGREHEWKALSYNLSQYSKKVQCPYCYSRGGKFCVCNSVAASEKLMKGYAESNPPAETIAQRSLIRLKWNCTGCDQPWVSSPRQRLFFGARCRNCKRKSDKHPVLSEGRPELLEEWDFSKNREDPHRLTLASNKKVWWVCKRCNSSWQTPVYARAIRGAGCFSCREKNRFTQKAGP